MRTAGRVGLEPVEPRIDFARVMERIQKVVRQAGARDSAEHLEAEGVEVIRAFGCFARPRLLVAGGRELPFRAAIAATAYPLQILVWHEIVNADETGPVNPTVRSGVQ